MPDALQILRDDHKRVKELFREFEATDNRQAQKRLVDTALIELEVHTTLEEELFYPVLRQEGEAELMDEAEEEHHVAELLIDELRRVRQIDSKAKAKFMVLAESVKHHIDEEESEVLPKAAEVGPERLQQIGQQMEQRKQQLMMEMQSPSRTRTRARNGSSTRRRTTRAPSTASGASSVRGRSTAGPTGGRSNGRSRSTGSRTGSTSRARTTAAAGSGRSPASSARRSTSTRRSTSVTRSAASARRRTSG